MSAWPWGKPTTEQAEAWWLSNLALLHKALHEIWVRALRLAQAQPSLESEAKQ